MRQLSSVVGKIFSVVAVVALLLVMNISIFAPGGVAHAATRIDSPRNTTYQNVVVPNSCGSFTLTTSPSSQNTSRYTTVNIVVTIHCPNAGYVPIFLDWRDGTNPDFQPCGSSVFNTGCNDGVYLTFSHQYTRTGNFLAKAYDQNNTTINSYSWVYVH